MSWIPNPSDERVALAAQLLADEQMYKYRSHLASVDARQALRDRMEMIVTIDRAGASRSIAEHTEASHG